MTKIYNNKKVDWVDFLGYDKTTEITCNYISDEIELKLDDYTAFILEPNLAKEVYELLKKTLEESCYL